MDIRKWFTSSKSKESSSVADTNKRSSNKSEQKQSPEKNKVRSAKKRQIIESDSDEDPLPDKEKTKNRKHSKNGSAKGCDSSKVSKEILKEVSAGDFFGSKPISKKKKEPDSPQKKKDEISVHEDTDFEKTLKQIDAAPIKKESQVKKSTVEKQENKKGKSPSSKRKSVNSPKVEITPNIKKSPEEKPKTKVVKDEKPASKKPRTGNANYASYLHREGPKALGSKEIPEGEEDCLAGLTFIITGILESMERDEAKALIEKYGGKVMTTLSKNTKYMVIGRDAGSSKLEKAEKLGTTQLDEDGLLDLIGTLPGKPGSAKKKPAKKSLIVSSPSQAILKGEDSLEAAFLEDDEGMDFDDSFIEGVEEEKKPKRSSSDKSPSKIKKGAKSEEKPTTSKSESTTKSSASKCESTTKSFASKSESTTKSFASKSESTTKSSSKSGITTDAPVSTSMWVDKYKPNSIKQIIGQQGDKSNAKKLLQWLLNWKKNRKLNKKAIPGRFNANDDGSGFKAALLSGSPGVGKTTTAQLVCKEAGYDYLELNASDTRSKKSLQQVVSQLLGNQTLADCFKEDAGKVSSNHVVIMDEVDGMAGNEDRGGIMELIGFIKSSKIPIICICNDRNHPKIRSLSNYCFDLRFQRPRVEQIKAAMLSIAFKEQIKVSPEALQDVIVASNQDVRQVLHNMSVWSAKSKGLSSEQTKIDIGRGTKHIKMNPFDVLREIFAIGNNKKATLIDKSDLFFHDYSVTPLFVQENYVHVLPTESQGDKKKHLTLLSEAADSICIGDVIDRQIRSQSSWGLLPTQAIFASVVPGELMKGHLKQMINFPAWFGKNSNRARMDRILQELHVHMRMKITGNKTDVALDYLPLLKRSLTKPLVDKEQEGIPEVLQIMEQYYLLREDFDSIIDLSLWPGQTDPRTKIITKVKSAFTRAYNKECGKNPYSISNMKIKKGSAKDLENELEDNENIESEEDGDDESIEKDAMIKVKKPAKKSNSESDKPSTSKEKKKNPSKKGKGK